MKDKKINRLDFVDDITQEEKERGKIISNAIKTTLLSFQVVIFLISISVAVFLIAVSKNLPDINLVKNFEPEQSTQIFDVNDELITEVIADEDRIYVPLDKISPHFLRSVIAIEDIRFYNHTGVDLKGTIRAFVNNLTGASSIQGGSSITQQLAKNYFLVPSKTFHRKFLEAILASRIENNFSKEEILEKYVNLIYLGSRSYGIERAAKKYFNKKAKDLDLAESSFIAALIKAPEHFSPYTNFEEAKQRQQIVLERLYKYGYITEEQKQEAINKELKFESPEIGYSKYPYFVDHVLYLLRKRYGENVVRTGGLKVYTTLDPEVQEIAQKTINDGVARMRYSRIKEGALVSIDVETGHIKAIVGGVDYEKSKFNRATLSKRATGSGFKPIVYLTGLRLGLITPDTIVLDAPVSYRTKWNVWRPRNWDGRFMGRMTAKKALAISRNTPAVRIALEAGVDNVIETARLLGIRSHMDRGYSIVLGSSGLSPLEVATAYTTLARDGIYLEPTPIRSVIDNKGNLLELSERQPIRVISSKFVRQLNMMLVEAVEKGTGKQARLEGRMVAGKTGTTDKFKDIWFSGYTSDTATVIWLGNDESDPIGGVYSSYCVGLWKNFSEKYYEKKKIAAMPFKLPVVEKELEIKKKPKKKPKVTLPQRTYVPERKPIKPRITPQQRQVQKPRQYYQYPQYPYYRYPQYQYPQQQYRYQQPQYQQPQVQQPQYQQPQQPVPQAKPAQRPRPAQPGTQVAPRLPPGHAYRR